MKLIQKKVKKNVKKIRKKHNFNKNYYNIKNIKVTNFIARYNKYLYKLYIN